MGVGVRTMLHSPHSRGLKPQVGWGHATLGTTHICFKLPLGEAGTEGTRKGYTGSFNWVSNGLFLKRTGEENPAQCESSNQPDGICIGVYIIYYYIILDTSLYSSTISK